MGQKLGKAGELPEVELSESGMKISPLESDHPDGAKALNENANGMLPRLKITDLLLEGDRWTHFTRHFSHLKTDEPPKDFAWAVVAPHARGIYCGTLFGKGGKTSIGDSSSTDRWNHVASASKKPASGWQRSPGTGGFGYEVPCAGDLCFEAVERREPF